MGRSLFVAFLIGVVDLLSFPALLLAAFVSGVISYTAPDRLAILLLIDGALFMLWTWSCFRKNRGRSREG